MSKPHALLTDREREIINGAADVSDEYQDQTHRRVRRRFDRLREDLTIPEHHDTLADELREVVCNE